METPEHRHRVCVFRLWMQLKLMNTTRINHAIFSWSLNSTQAGIKNWGFRVKTFLQGLDMDEVSNVDRKTLFKISVSSGMSLSQTSLYLQIRCTGSTHQNTWAIEARI